MFGLSVAIGPTRTGTPFDCTGTLTLGMMRFGRRPDVTSDGRIVMPCGTVKRPGVVVLRALVVVVVVLCAVDVVTVVVVLIEVGAVVSGCSPEDSSLPWLSTCAGTTVG